MFWVILFILIWICSFVMHVIWKYHDYKRVIFKVGDLIDKIETYMWIPVINTLALITIIVAFVVDIIADLLKLPELWEKFRNIKLK